MIDLGPELQDFGKAIGLLDGSGNLDSGWFADPISKLETLLSAQSQREALVNILDAFVPADRCNPLVKSYTTYAVSCCKGKSKSRYRLVSPGA